MTAFTMQLPALMERAGHGLISAGYDASEPYAITFGFDTVQPGLEWVISRDLLADGLIHGKAGEGDVKVTARGDLVVLGLCSPDGSAAVVLRRDDVDILLDRVYRIVARGAESQHLDWSDTTEFPGVAL
ncbi:SsgA family sporulation/cell division regulator [Amycolatopsis sp. FDAARGOS 1241]|uniref:SsgA family sporulation/cell division regulator n=1 Tax=Amycolatopsis sp. FDAARGOS 1241 TaxID=2778070 RepID=UPI00194F48C9|nr:SsgA family sporulation/cell division regulator [Amycolatopsis sp. FDAARGOS 1241]QRP45780.1 SsgA family sporulation/cell division regulator [Amycolatopsis sp. FDAARGOS 1241]